MNSKLRLDIDLRQNLNNEKTMSDSGDQLETSFANKTFYSQQQQLLNKCKNNRKKLIRRLMYFVSFFNLLTLLCLIFSMAFYEWVYVTIIKTYGENDTIGYWVNQLYMKSDTLAFYESFNQVKLNMCQGHVYCEGVIEGFKFSGYLCFSFFAFAALVQIFDVIKMGYTIYNFGNIFQERGHFRHAIFVGSYFIGLSLSVFSSHVIKDTQKFGISFWVCLGALVLWPSVLAYGQYKVNKIQKQVLIQNLLEQQKKLRCNQILQPTFLSDQGQQNGQQITL